MGEHYETPKSMNMLSHLTNAQALRDYKYENARKLVRRQEDLLRSLAKVRAAIEQEEGQIGKARDYYAGSSEEKFGHTLNRADKLRRQRDKAKEAEVTAEISTVKAPTSKYFQEEYSLPALPISYTLSTRAYHNYGEGKQNFKSDIQRLKDQVENITTRYKEEPEYAEDVKYQEYSPEYYPGARYVKDFNHPDEEARAYVSDHEIAQYFPVTRYVLH